MDNGAHRENGRPRPPQGQWFAQHQPSMKQIMAVMTERDAAIQERNLALSEKKSALAERDIAILQRDSAISDRNTAMMERENAITTLQMRENAIKSGAKHIYRHMENPPYNNPREIQLINEPVPSSPPPQPKPKRAKEPKETTPNKKPAKKKVKRERKEYEEGSRPKPTWKDQNLGLNQVAYDDSTMPVPVCSCTGVYRPCYKWGSGGWQSSCCTTTMSQYPLPPVPHKRHARIGGRKMSGSAFNKLLSRLAAEGHDLANPVDLKDNWARHGTNRYITIK